MVVFRNVMFFCNAVMFFYNVCERVCFRSPYVFFSNEDMFSEYLYMFFWNVCGTR